MTDQATASEERVSSINAMLRTEKNSYEAVDYLRFVKPSTYGDFPVDRWARDAIVDWFVKIVKTCDYSLETAAIAASILDRFAAVDESKDILIHRQQFQLASLAAIYTAAKVHEGAALSPMFVAKLSGGIHSAEDIEKMEFRVLQAVQWRVHPPTAEWFVRCYLDLIPGMAFDKSTRMALMKLIRFQVTHSLLNYEFCSFRASDIALASLLNGVEAFFGCKFSIQVENAIRSTTNIKATQCLNRLRTSLCGANYRDVVSKLRSQQEGKSLSNSKTMYSRNKVIPSTHELSPKSVSKLTGNLATYIHKQTDMV
eukprot:scaffold23625_cov137-Cylindrotheca_fusiformis.AAC.19